MDNTKIKNAAIGAAVLAGGGFLFTKFVLKKHHAPISLTLAAIGAIGGYMYNPGSASSVAAAMPAATPAPAATA
jgi:hypothetical protein